MKRRLLAILLFVSVVGVACLYAAEVDSSVIDRAQKSVYLIHGQKEHGRYACSGFLIADEQVLTAAHCVGDQMTVAGIAATVAESDEYYDLALLRVPIHGTPLAFRDTPIARFEQLAAIGHAYGWQRITALHVRVYHVNLTPMQGMRPGMLVKPGYIGGMSGGPVIDADGFVVGIIQASNQDLGYGIGITLIRAFLVGT